MFLGTFSFSLYPLGTNIICQNLKNNEMFKGLEYVLTGYGVGCVIGPIYVSFLIKILGSSGFFMSFSTLLIILILTIILKFKKLL